METLLHISPVLINLIRYFVLAGIPFVIFYLLMPKKFTRNKIQVKYAKSKEFRREILNSVFSMFIWGVVISFILFTPLRAYAKVYENINEYPIWWLPASVVLMLLIQDTYFYWLHRAIHHPKVYKLVHREHHKSTNPSPWTSYSFHALEAIVEVLFIPVIIFSIPVYPWAFSVFATASFMMNVYGHLGYEIAPRWIRNSFLFEILSTSVHHNMHHEKIRGNYGLYFRLWDRLMKTEHHDYVKRYDFVQEQRFEKLLVKEPIIKTSLRIKEPASSVAPGSPS